MTDNKDKAYLRPISLNFRRIRDVNLGNRVLPVVASGREFSADAVETAVNVNEPLSRLLLSVAGCCAARGARDVRAELVVHFSACVHYACGRHGNAVSLFAECV